MIIFYQLNRRVGNWLNQYNEFQVQIRSTRACFGHISLIRTRNHTLFLFFFDSLLFKELSIKISDFFLNQIDQLGTLQPVRRVSLRGALFLLILGPKSYLVRAYKPQISLRNGLGLVLGHVMGFLKPTLGPLGYLVVKERSKCGQLWTLGIDECLWSWGSPRLIGGVLRTEGAHNGVSSKRKKEKRRTKNVKEKKKIEGKEERRKKEKEREIL